MEVVASIATFEALGGILKGINFCVHELIYMRRAWKDGPQDLADFTNKVELFQDVLGKVEDIIKHNRKRQKQVKQLCRGVLNKLKSFIAGFSESLSYMDQSRLAKFRVQVRWYWVKSKADSLQREMSDGYTMLNLLVSIDEVQKNVALIQKLCEAISDLEKGKGELIGLREEVEKLKQKNVKLKAKCNAEIKKMEDKMQSHGNTQADRGMHQPEAVLSREAKRFIHQTLKPVVQENEGILELDRNSPWSSSKDRPKSFSSSSEGRPSSRTASRECSSRPGDVAPTSPVPPTSPRHRSSARRASLRSLRQEDMLDSLHSRESSSQEVAETLSVHPLSAPLPYLMEEPAVHVDDIELAPSEDPADGLVESNTGSDYVLVEVSEEDIASDVASSDEIHTPDSATVAETATSPNSVVERQEYLRKMEYDFNEHVENEMSEKRAMLNKERERAEAEARLAGRPRGRRAARALNQRRLLSTTIRLL